MFAENHKVNNGIRTLRGECPGRQFVGAQKFSFAGHGLSELRPFAAARTHDIRWYNQAGQLAGAYFVQNTQNEIAFNVFFVLVRLVDMFVGPALIPERDVGDTAVKGIVGRIHDHLFKGRIDNLVFRVCLLYTSDAADD